jgi:hypothetical protein
MSKVDGIICYFVSSYEEIQELKGNPLWDKLCIKEWKVCDNGRIVFTGWIHIYDADTGEYITSIFSENLRQSCYDDP